MADDLDRLLGIDRTDPEQQLASDLVESIQSMVDELRNIQDRQGLSSADVAEKLGISEKSYLNAVRLGSDPRLSTITRIALAVGARIQIYVEEADRCPCGTLIAKCVECDTDRCYSCDPDPSSICDKPRQESDHA